MSHHFYDTIHNLRTNEEITIFEKLIPFKNEDEDLVKAFLEIEFEQELIAIPCPKQTYNAAAALWGAKTIYTACQLLLYRENKEHDLLSLFSPFPKSTDIGTILSIDLCLRFLPQVIEETKRIDAADALISILENILETWHYSSIGYTINNEKIDYTILDTDVCLRQMYVDRIIEKKDLGKMKIPTIAAFVKASLGIYANKFWKELTLQHD